MRPGWTLRAGGVAAPLAVRGAGVSVWAMAGAEPMIITAATPMAAERTRLNTTEAPNNEILSAMTSQDGRVKAEPGVFQSLDARTRRA
jgi:hypothetical protein